MMEPIDVVFCVDAAFWQPLGVTLSSLLQANARDQFRVFIVSAVPPAAAEWERLEALAKATDNATLTSILFGSTALYAHLPAKGHLSVAMYLRLFVAEFLPPEVQRVVYLDSDLLVRSSSFRELWEWELGDAYLGAAYEPYDARQRLGLGFGSRDFYFNSGVMVINLRKWRDDGVTARLLAFADANTEQLSSPDQDVLNCVMRGQVVDIGVKWNWQALFPRLLPEELRISAEQYHELRRLPAIVHFTSAYKPWMWRWEPHYKHLYQRAQKRSPWSGVPPSDKQRRHLPVKLKKMFQRNLEWSFPALARRLRELAPTGAAP